MCAIVPLSTSVPRIALAHHLKITMIEPLPAPYNASEMWVKGDIVLTVAFHRLRLLYSHQANGQRIYDVRVLQPELFERVRTCVRLGLGL